MKKAPKKIVRLLPKSEITLENREEIIEAIQKGEPVLIPVQPTDLEGIELYRALKEHGFPQGGQGSYMSDPQTAERFYIPKPDEIFNQFLANPEGWQNLVDVMSRAWIANKK